MSKKEAISIVIPVYNEEENVSLVFKQLMQLKDQFDLEVIFVNDGSDDNTVESVKKLRKVILINFRRNFGQTAAMLAGFRQANNKIIVSIDGDGQNDPQDIPRLVKKLKKGYDVVCGWRKQRQDPLSKKVISRGADYLRKIILHDHIHDSGCTLKAYRQECFADLDLYGETHRFIPAILEWKGFKVTEVSVKHHFRKYGHTKYNFTRTLKGFIDIINIWFWYKYSARPLHLFGGLGLLLVAFGLLVLGVMTVQKLFYNIALAERIWPLVGFFSILAGIQLFVSGILADIGIKNYFNSPHKSTYAIKEIIKL